MLNAFLSCHCGSLAHPGATNYFRYHLHEALGETGIAERYLDQLGPWLNMVANGLTSTAETPEPTR